MNEDDDQLRVNTILRDIYNRHGIPEDQQNPALAAKFLSQKHADEVGQLSGGSADRFAWANPQERAEARKTYALKGVDSSDTEARWGRSQYLMDPATARVHQDIGRDRDFVSAVALAPQPRTELPPPMPKKLRVFGEAYDTPIDTDAGLEHAARQKEMRGALDRWDRSGKEGNLYRNSWREPNTFNNRGLAGGLGNAISNSDSPLGNAFQVNNLPFAHLTSHFSGENGPNDALDVALTYINPLLKELRSEQGTHVGPIGSQLHEWRHRLNNHTNQSPVLDLPAGAAPQERAERLAELDALDDAAAQPDMLERSHRTLGWSPSPAVGDAADALMSMVDFTLPFSLGGKGWLRGLMRDARQEQVVNGAINAALPGNQDRTYAQYLFGTGEAPEIKTPEQLAEAREARQKLYDDNGGMLGMLLGGPADSVSKADSAAYKELQDAGRVPIGLHRRRP